MKIKFIHFVFLLLVSFGYSQDKLDIFDVARKGTLEQAKEILKTNPKAAVALNADGNSALLLAVYKNNNPVAQFLIDNGADINGTAKMGTPLMAAVVKGNTEAVKMLLNKKADINGFDDNGVTALIYAVQFGNIELVKLFLNNKADKKHTDKQGKTAFEYAVFAGNEEIINSLK